MKARSVVGKNLVRLIQWHADRGETTLDSINMVAKASGVSRGTVQRIPAGKVGISIDVLEQIAAPFGLQAWQLLVPGLDPANPPVVSVTVEERELWARMQERMRFVERGGANADPKSGTDSLGSRSKSKGRSKKTV